MKAQETVRKQRPRENFEGGTINVYFFDPADDRDWGYIFKDPAHASDFIESAGANYQYYNWQSF